MEQTSLANPINALKIKSWHVGPGEPLCFILGPCVIESEEHTMRCAEFLSTLARHKNFRLIYKSSYDKANRTAHDSFRGVGLEKGLTILEKVKNTFGIAIITDVHTPEEAQAAGQVCDMIQIPAFLCRQTDLIIAAGKSGCAVNVKKGQFLAPWDMGQVVEKLESSGCFQILLTDRGSSFGYNNLVCDMRSVPVMHALGYPVCFDASHAVQLPGGHGKLSGGQRQYIPTLARAAVAAGCDAVFIESHPQPESALSDKHTVYPFAQIADLIDQLVALRQTMIGFSKL